MVANIDNSYIHAHDLGSGRGESDPMIPRRHGIKRCPIVLDGTLCHFGGILFIAHVWTWMGVYAVRFQVFGKNKVDGLKRVKPRVTTEKLTLTIWLRLRLSNEPRTVDWGRWTVDSELDGRTRGWPQRQLQTIPMRRLATYSMVSNCSSPSYLTPQSHGIVRKRNGDFRE